MSPELLTAIDALLAAINTDNGAHGGLLSRETIRKADELRLALDAERNRKREVAA